MYSAAVSPLFSSKWQHWSRLQKVMNWTELSTPCNSTSKILNNPFSKISHYMKDFYCKWEWKVSLNFLDVTTVKHTSFMKKMFYFIVPFMTEVCHTFSPFAPVMCSVISTWGVKDKSVWLSFKSCMCSVHQHIWISCVGAPTKSWIGASYKYSHCLRSLSSHGGLTHHRCIKHTESCLADENKRARGPVTLCQYGAQLENSIKDKAVTLRFLWERQWNHSKISSTK